MRWRSAALALVLLGCNALLGNEEGVLVGGAGQGASAGSSGHGATAGSEAGGEGGASPGVGAAGAGAAEPIAGDGGRTTCAADETRCNAEGEREQCQQASWDAAPCEADEVCHAGECLDCAPQDHRCVGARLEECTDQGSWSFAETCSGATPVCNDVVGKCVALRVVGSFAGKQTSTQPNVRVAGQFWVRPNLCKSNTCVRGGFSP